MDLSPLLSICIPTYNRASFLRETLSSIESQLTNKIEIVISDNDSNDNTFEIVELFRIRNPEVKLVYFKHEMNVGADRNYLKTVELSSGGYCWLFGSDDLMKPGSIDLILSEIITKCDVYLCGFTLCTYKMGPIAEHLIFESTRDKVYELDDDISRHNYFKHAKTSTAFFSFLGSLIVNKKKWDMVEIDEKKFIGSLWVHVAKIFGMIPFGLKVKYISKPLLLKRGENDSFLEKGIANRIGVSVYGYKMIGDYFFFNNSLETSNIQRVIKFEWPLSAFVSYKTVSLNEKNQELTLLNKVFYDCYAGENFEDRFSRFVYKSNALCFFYLFIINSARKIKTTVKKLKHV